VAPSSSSSSSSSSALPASFFDPAAATVSEAAGVPSPSKKPRPAEAPVAKKGAIPADFFDAAAASSAPAAGQVVIEAQVIHTPLPPGAPLISLIECSVRVVCRVCRVSCRVSCACDVVFGAVQAKPSGDAESKGALPTGFFDDPNKDSQMRPKTAPQKPSLEDLFFVLSSLFALLRSFFVLRSSFLCVC
jgi:hypothetical protein